MWQPSRKGQVNKLAANGLSFASQVWREFKKVLQCNKTNESLDHFFPLTEYPQMRKWILMSMEKDGGFLPNPES